MLRGDVYKRQSVDCATPEGWKKVNKRTFTKVFTASGEYSVTLTSATGVTGDAYVFSITNIDKEAPVIDYAAIEAAKGYKRDVYKRQTGVFADCA